MLTKIDAYNSGCEKTISCRLFLCAGCRRQSLVCRRCDRGEVYCGRGCATEARRGWQREARRRHQATDRGRQMHAERSRKYRTRGRRVTDQGRASAGIASAGHPSVGHPAMKARIAVNIATGLGSACHRCGHSVADPFRLAPLRRPDRRPIHRRPDGPACGRRQKTTDSQRR